MTLRSGCNEMWKRSGVLSQFGQALTQRELQVAAGFWGSFLRKGGFNGANLLLAAFMVGQVCQMKVGNMETRPDLERLLQTVFGQGRIAHLFRRNPQIGQRLGVARLKLHRSLKARESAFYLFLPSVGNASHIVQCCRLWKPPQRFR